MRYLSAVLGIVALVLATTSSAQKPKKVNCLKDLKKAVKLIDARWSFKLFKPGAFDLEGTYKQLESEAREARRPEACADVLARFMAQLNDGHSRLQYFPGLDYTAPKIVIRSQRERLSRIPGQAPPIHAYVFSRDTTDEALRAILPGSEILAIDGVGIDSMYAFMARRASGSTAHWRDYMCDRQLLLGPAETEIDLAIREPGGARRSVTVLRPPVPSEDEMKREREIYMDTVRIARWKRLEGGWGYLKYTTFSFRNPETTVAAFDEAAACNRWDGPWSSEATTAAEAAASSAACGCPAARSSRSRGRWPGDRTDSRSRGTAYRPTSG